ncbi:exported hypothetical protein [Vibrio nigripulchritudo FTn2]|uniref:hypothetical protein n=1 Tax=Vibrio nigripulchritudo TaxID=28173 RepID=UPI0003B1CD14|nr:hypothetical protein [Vibrio nigripulchritudo]CCN40117.1 exported hypothetical protein [Vibrio nigripulchritudo FTn2]
MKNFPTILLAATALFCSTTSIAKVITQPQPLVVDDATSFSDIVCGNVKGQGRQKFVRYQYEREQFPTGFLETLEREFGEYFESIEKHADYIVLVNIDQRRVIEPNKIKQCKNDVVLFALQNIIPF